jgi:hypothetical protein
MQTVYIQPLYDTTKAARKTYIIDRNVLNFNETRSKHV